MTGDPDKEYGTNKPPLTRRVPGNFPGCWKCFVYWLECWLHRCIHLSELSELCTSLYVIFTWIKNKIKKKKKISSGGVLLFDKHLNRPSLITLSEKAMAPHSSTLAWKIPWIGGPGRLQSMGSWRVGHDWATSLSLFTFTHWRRKWQPTPVFLPGESQGRGTLMGCRLWGRTESDTTEAT